MAPLPDKPRLRTSFWFEGAALKCELVLMGERRELVHRETFDVPRGSVLERIHSGLVSTAGRLAEAKAQLLNPTPAPAPVAEHVVDAEPSPENEQARRARLEELAAEAERRAAEMPAEPEEPEPELEPELEPLPSLENEQARRARLEELAAEAERRAAEAPAELEEAPTWEPEPEPEPEATPEARLELLQSLGAGAGHPSPETLIQNTQPDPTEAELDAGETTTELEPQES